MRIKSTTETQPPAHRPAPRGKIILLCVLCAWSKAGGETCRAAIKILKKYF